jgi:hypothetical protein
MKERLRLEQEVRLLIPGPAHLSARERETAAGLRRKLKHLALLRHSVEQGGADVELKPAVLDPKFYDGTAAYLVAQKLQECLMRVMAKREYRQMKVALVDLTKDVMKPEFAGFNHKEQVFAASVPKLAAMLAAFQLRHDMLAAKKLKTPATAAELFAAVRDDWADTQRDPGGKAQPFARGLAVRGKLVLVGGTPVTLVDPKGPRLEEVFGDSMSLDFTSTGQTLTQLKKLVSDFNLAVEKKAVKTAQEELKSALRSGPGASERVRDARKKLADATKALGEARGRRPQAGRDILALGFRERLGVAVGGDVPASNLATSTVVRDVGYLYIASSLLQSGLYDTTRSPQGGLWLGADYAKGVWRGGLVGGGPQSANAGSLASFMTLIVQRRLVSPAASGEMRDLLIKVPALKVPGTGSWFQQGLAALSLKTVLAKVGLAGGADDFAFIERDASITAADGSTKTVTLRYVAVALRATNGTVLESVIRELDRCIVDNNS